MEETKKQKVSLGVFIIFYVVLMVLYQVNWKGENIAAIIFNIITIIVALYFIYKEDLLRKCFSNDLYSMQIMKGFLFGCIVVVLTLIRYAAMGGEPFRNLMRIHTNLIPFIFIRVLSIAAEELALRGYMYESMKKQNFSWLVIIFIISLLYGGLIYIFYGNIFNACFCFGFSVYICCLRQYIKNYTLFSAMLTRFTYSFCVEYILGL